MILQERIEELGSGILNLKGLKVELIGFTCSDRLYGYYDKSELCHFSMGIYDYEPLNFSRIKDGALFIINDNGTESRYQFNLLKKESVNYKDSDNKPLSKVYSIRKCFFTHKFNYKDSDVSILFDTEEDLERYFKRRFGNDLFL